MNIQKKFPMGEAHEEPTGRFLVFEGMDGSGKGEMIKRALEFLRLELGHSKVIGTKEPGGTLVGDQIRDVVFDKQLGSKVMAPGVVDLLFLSSHIQNTEEVIKPALNNGLVVVCDRYWYSQLVYMRERPLPKPIEEVYWKMRGPRADRLFILHGDPHVLHARANRRALDGNETHQVSKAWNDIEKLTRIQERYLEYFGGDPETVLINVDNRAPDEVFELLRPYLEVVVQEVKSASHTR